MKSLLRSLSESKLLGIGDHVYYVMVQALMMVCTNHYVANAAVTQDIINNNITFAKG